MIFQPYSTAILLPTSSPTVRSPYGPGPRFARVWSPPFSQCHVMDHRTAGARRVKIHGACIHRFLLAPALRIKGRSQACSIECLRGPGLSRVTDAGQHPSSASNGIWKPIPWSGRGGEARSACPPSFGGVVNPASALRRCRAARWCARTIGEQTRQRGSAPRCAPRHHRPKRVGEAARCVFLTLTEGGQWSLVLPRSRSAVRRPRGKARRTEGRCALAHRPEQPQPISSRLSLAQARGRSRSSG